MRILQTIMLTIWFVGAASAQTGVGDSVELVAIDSESGEPYRSIRLAMFKQLEEYGYRQGENLKAVHESLDNYEGRAVRLWQTLGYQKRHVFFINGTVAARAFYKLAWNDGMHRFVYCGVTDPVGMGLVDDFDKPPKANFTGVSYSVPVKERVRFVKRLFPKARKIGLIYADMPQSHSYRRWLEELLRTDEEFKGMEVLFRMVPFVKSAGGHIRMAMLAQRHIRELDGQVDVFLSPNDQMGVQRPFAEMVSRTASKPLVGVGSKDVTEGWGATASIAPVLPAIGQQCALMVKQLLEGKSIEQIRPEAPRAFEIALDVAKAKSFGADLSPQLLKEAADRLVGD